ncbi:MAG: amidophosphoribosyltransferase, partial [Gordonia sp. (in: high G+C Gram-positive bacteria)]
DSIVRGNTQRALIRMLREAGAAEVHVRIASSPVRWPCFYGIDFASPAELIANGMESEEGMVEGVRQAIGADSLGYIGIDEMIAATGQAADSLCAACFDGKYPIELPKETSMGKAVLETMLKTSRADTIIDPLVVENDNVSAVMRP